MQDQRVSFSNLSVGSLNIQQLCFLILYGFTELSNYTCQVLLKKKKKVMLSNFFNPPKRTQSRLLEWQQ